MEAGSPSDLIYNRTPLFTQSVIPSSLLASPLVVIDVGVHGGIHARWRHLGSMLKVHGFDAQEDAIAPLRAQAGENERYYAMALGNEDGERELFISAEPTATSFYPRQPSSLAFDERVTTSVAVRDVPIRRLDSLLAEGTISGADFIKIDCEGFEPDILRGAQKLIASGVLAVELESTFDATATAPQGHLAAVCELLLPHGFALYDIALDRIPRTAFTEKARELRIRHPAVRARPVILNVLFYRETPPATRDELIKRAIILELYGANDAAHDLLREHAAMLPKGGAPLADLFIRRLTLRERAKLFKRWLMS
jgi:FkbM family methyltransferase